MTLYSVVITTHDRPRLLPRAIASVKSQSEIDTQTIIVSDRFCPETYAAASSLLDGNDIFIHRAGTAGPAQSRNLGMSLATGDYVIFLDDDDALSSDFLRTASQYVDGNTVLYSDYSVVMERFEGSGTVILGGERRSLSSHELPSIYTKNFIPPACLIYPRTAVANREFDPSLVLNEDWEFILSVMSSHPLRYIPIDGPVVYVRQTADNRGRTNDHLLLQTYLDIYGKRPAPTLEQQLSRQSLLSSVGFEIELEKL